jgi:hypothetical protein
MSIINTPSGRPLVEYLYNAVVSTMHLWTDINDIYAIWMCVSLEEDDPARPFLDEIVPMRESCITVERLQKFHGQRYAPVFFEKEDIVSLCLCQEPYIPQDEKWDGYMARDGDPKGLALWEAVRQHIREQPEYQPDEYHELDAFLDICGAVISQLHKDSVIVSVCQKPVPIGIMCGNDMRHDRALSQVRDNNPLGLTVGMEEWMRPDMIFLS